MWHINCTTFRDVHRAGLPVQTETVSYLSTMNVFNARQIFVNIDFTHPYCWRGACCSFALLCAAVVVTVVKKNGDFKYTTCTDDAQ